MSTKTYRGDAPQVAQVNTITPANVNIGNTFTATINGKSATYTAAAATVADVTAGESALAGASTRPPEFKELSWVDSATLITVTGPSDGTPFTQTSSASGGTATFTTATTTTASGPNDWSVAANWSASGVPGADDVYIRQTNVDIKYGLDQNAVTLASLNLDSTFTGDLGLPISNALGYYEYRQAELKIGITTLNVGDTTGNGAGSQRIRINGQAIQTTINVYGTGAPKEQGIKAFLWRGTHASNVLNMWKGSAGIATLPGEAATLATVNIGSKQNPASDVDLLLSSGCTLTTINQYGGQLECNAAVTTWTIGAGDAVVNGTGAITTLTMEEGAGTIVHKGSGTITNLNIGPGAVFDRSATKTAITVTNCTISPGGSIKDPNKTITFTNPFTLSRHGIATAVAAGLDLGSNISLQRS